MRCVSVIDGGLKCLEQLPMANPSQTLNKICIKYSWILSLAKIGVSFSLEGLTLLNLLGVILICLR